MGRLGPLTSQALGRSPYDDVVQGEGETDPRAPLQMYDERGRPVNPETRQINKDIIRSHNEVMQVIGVAEPENGVQEPQASSSLRHRQWEDSVGLRLLRIGHIVSATGAWGVGAMRTRILLYRDYSSIPLHELWNFERSHRSITAIVLAGYPAFMASIYSKLKPSIFPQFDNVLWYRFIKHWLRLHLGVFGCLQQFGIIPGAQLLPNYKFFIPCTSISPIRAPPPPASISASELAKWTGRLVLNVAPLLAIYVCQRVWGSVRRNVWYWIRNQLPEPRNPVTRRHTYSRQDWAPASEFNNPPQTPSLQPQPPNPPLPAPISPGLVQGMVQADNQDQQLPNSHPLEGGAPAPTEPVSLGTVRRQSTFSTRGTGAGDYYASDDEDNSADMVSTTLISFDVEATDATDPPPGQWSAELRPNIIDGRPAGSNSRQPVYRSTALTRLPAGLAADMLVWFPTRWMAVPTEMVVWRWFLRGYMASRGLGVEGVYGVRELGLGWRGIGQLLALDLVYLFVQGEIWAVMYQVANGARMTEEEWEYVDGEDEASENRG